MEEKKLKINNLEINCEALIEFSSLANVLLELVKKQDEIDQKLLDHDNQIKNLQNMQNSQINNKNENLTDIFWQNKDNETSLIGESVVDNLTTNDLNNEHNKTQEKLITAANSLNSKNIKKKFDDNSLIENNNIAKKEHSKKSSEELNIIKKPLTNFAKSDKKLPIDYNDEKNFKKEYSSPKISPEIIPKLAKTVKDMQKQISYLYTKSNEHITLNQNINSNKNLITADSNKIDTIFQEIENLKKQLENDEKDLEKVNEKVQDFDIYDIFKSSEGKIDGSANVDVCKSLIKILETKIFKKFELFDTKVKLNKDEIQENKNHIKNMMSTIENLKIITKESEEKFYPIEKLLEKIKKENTNTSKLLQDQIDSHSNNLKDINDNIESSENNFNNKLKELEEKLTQNITEIITNKEIENCKDGNVRNEDIDLIKSFNKRISELEKEIRNILNKLNIEEINNKLTTLKKDIDGKSGKYEINEIKGQIYNIDENMKDTIFKIESLQTLEEKHRSEISQITKKLENLVGEFSIMKVSSGMRKEEKPIDLSKFIDNNQFNELKKDSNIKFDRIKHNFEDFSRTLEDIIKKLKNMPTNIDFNNYQNLIKNILEELKINCNKKYCDKFDTLKIIKRLENQIKTCQDSFSKKMDGSDNWLLAKKPLNSFLCASCENVIRGELDKRGDYIPWNKYPKREEKYRMGHGFSHLLQMMNDEIKFNVEKEFKENKSRSSSEDEKKNKKIENNNDNSDININNKVDINSIVKLPNLRHRNKQSFSIDEVGIGERAITVTNDDIYAEKYHSLENEPQIMKIKRRGKKLSGLINLQKNSSNLKRGINVVNNNDLKIEDDGKNKDKGKQTSKKNINSVSKKEISMTDNGL